MRTVLFLATLLVSQAFPGRTQNSGRLVSRNYENFYEWFHRQSQVTQLYGDNTTLYVFTDKAQVHSAPGLRSAVIAELSLGQAVRNIAYPEYELPEGRIDGYGDIWYHVSGRDHQGRSFSGYVWGANIARGWRQADITGDGNAEFVMLGIASRPRQSPTDINAEIRVLQNGRLIEQRLVPGLCIFEECDSSPLLRVLKDPAHPGMVIVEASAMTIGCEVGIEKAFFYWNGRQLDRVYHAEFTTEHEFARRDFVIPLRDAYSGLVIGQKVCHFSREDNQFNPVWSCQILPLDGQAAPVAGVAKVRAD